MYKIKRILVALDLTEIDDSIIDFVIHLTHKLSIDKVYFVTVLKQLDLPQEVADKYPEMLAPVDETVKKEIEFEIQRKGDEAVKAPYEIDVLEGNVTEKVLRWVKVKNIDLVILGNKSGTRGHGILTGKIAKAAPCSVALIPEVLPANLNELVVPLDFSESSKIATELAVTISNKNKDTAIKFLHVYSVPSGYHVSGKTYEEFGEIMKENAQKHYRQFISKVNLKGVKVSDHYKLQKDDQVAEAIYSFAVKQHASAIVIGSRGRTQAASFIMGSITEKIIHVNTHYTLIIAKSKKNTMDLLDALFGQ